MRKHIFFLSLVLIIFVSLNGQSFTESIYIDGVERTYIVHLPPDASTGMQDMPLVLNFHGLGSNATQQEFYTEMNGVADYFNFIVVYPDAIDNAWDVGFLIDSPTDVPFVEKIIDKMYFDHQIDVSKVYSCGMSNGGFFSYRLACEIPERIAAIASVTGSMLISEMNNCTTDNKMPVMQIHGTADSTVLYDGTAYTSSIEALMAFWAQKNACDTTLTIEDVPDVITSDACTAQIYTYNSCEKQTVLYKVDEGGHTWPGGAIDLDAGLTNRDVIASTEIWNFFNQFEIENPIIPQTTNVEEHLNNNYSLKINDNFVSIQSELPIQKVDIFNGFGQLLNSFNALNQNKFSHFIEKGNSKVLFFRIQIDEQFYTEKGFIF